MLQRSIIHTPLDDVNFEDAILQDLPLKEDQAVSHKRSLGET